MSNVSRLPGVSSEVRDALPPSLIKRLSETELKFAELYVNLKGDLSNVSAILGMTPELAQTFLYRYHVLDAIQRIVITLFATDSVAARAVILEIMLDVAQKGDVRIKAAMAILQLAKMDPGKTVTFRTEEDKKKFDMSKLTEAQKDQLEKLLALTAGEEPETIVGDSKVVAEF